jgi:hypothetical protein
VSVGGRESLLVELKAAAAAFARDAEHLERILAVMAEDVERAMREPLPLFPVMHHSPASAAQMVRYLEQKRPKLVFVEMCEDLLAHVADLDDCTFPVALQAFSSQLEGLPEAWAPLSVVAPLTEFGAEYQAIAYALRTPGVELVFVDRPVDLVFQWNDPTEDPDHPEDDDEDDVEDARIHGDAVGLQVGEVAPSFAEFRDVLLQNARMSRFEEWSNLYVEEPTIAAPVDAYREVMFLVGSLFRRLGSTPHDREEIRRRDRWMWTRIKQKLAETGVAPKDAVFLCGAAHAVCDGVPEWGVESDALWELPERTRTVWRYGLIPSSFAAIELQFGHARGAMTLARDRWRKAVKTWSLSPFELGKTKTKAPKKKKATAPPPEQLSLAGVLSRPPNLTEADAEELVGWCTGIVAAARDNRYLATTADAISIYETSILLARMRSRLRPTAYDFIDAAETCLEKGHPPGRRNIRQLCGKMLGGDLVGQVGYAALPPLVQEIYDLLEPVGITAKTRRVTRVLLDFDKHPEQRSVSRLLWQLHWLCPGSRVARPILGERKLGMKPRPESWDVTLHGAEQREVIQLSFEGVSVAQVLEVRLREAAFGDKATTATALEAIEAALTLLDESRLIESLAGRAIHLLLHEKGADDAPAIFDRVRRFVHYFRGTGGLPGWLETFVAEGYARYATQLPEGFGERHTSPEQLAAMLSFVFTLESLALAMGCSRSQVVIAIEQAAPLTADAEKLGLLWASEWLVQLRDDAELRSSFDRVLQSPLGRGAYPRYLSGFLTALGFAPRLAPLALALIGQAFQTLPDRVLLPWMPSLITALGPRRADALPGLLRELVAELPRSLGAVDAWTPSWQVDATPAAPAAVAPVVASPVHGFLRAHPAATDAWARALGLEGAWGEALPEASAAPASAPSGGSPLVAAFPRSAEAWAALFVTA